jgi:phospholipid/cholesterol/gamma-HCH transport system ATP-binding protein
MANTIHELIVSMHRKFRFTAVMVSHEIPEIFSISDYVAMLKHGRIIAMAESGEFQRTPDADVKEFISVGRIKTG